MDPSSKSMTTFAMAANAICFTKPDYYVLENVEGCRFLDCICVRLLRSQNIFMLTCHNVRMPRTGAKKGEAELENDTDHCRTPLQTYEQILRTKLPDYSMENVSISSTPLPETRSRVWILGSRNPSFSASTWKSLVLHLEAKAKEMVRHHFHSLSGPPTCREDG